MTRVVHVVLSLEVGGLERVVLDLARVARRRGEPVSILTVDRPGRLAAEAEALGVAVACLGGDRVGRAGARSAAGAALDALAPGVLHTHQIGAARAVVGAAARRGVPVVHTEHGNAFARASGPLARAKLRWVYARTARGVGSFCCVTREIAAAVGRFGTVRAPQTVANGVALPDPGDGGGAVRDELGVPRGAFVVGSVGRLHEVKRYDLMLRAVAELRSSRPDVHLVLVGDGPERAQLGALAGQLGLTPFVRFAGYRADPERYYAAFDAFALTSRSEGLPVSLLEAWAAGRAVVVTAVGGLPDVVTNGVNGILVAPGPGDDPGVVAGAIARVYADPALRASLGAAGRATVEAHYTLDRIADRYAAIYDRLAAAPPTSSPGVRAER